MRTPRCALWADMGMGKTVSVLTALANLNEVEHVFPALVLAPKRVAESVWVQEAQKWPHLRHMKMQRCLGNVNTRLKALGSVYDILCMNLENIYWLMQQFPVWPFKTIVVDEATRLKGYRKRSGAAYAKELAVVANDSRRFIELTGTPTPNGLLDLWGQMWFIGGGKRIGGTWTAYRDRWFTSDYMGYNWTPKPHAMKEIMGNISDLCLTLKAEDYFNLEKPHVVDVPAILPPKARAQYDEMERNMYAEIRGSEIEAANAAVLTGKCQQIANGAVFDADGSWAHVHDAKLEVLDSIATEAAGSPLLVVYQFNHDLARLRRTFPKAKTLDDGKNVEKEWNAGKVPMLLVHPKSAGHGLNLQYGGHRVVFFSLTWNLEHYQQVIERVGPMRQLQAGLKRVVYVYRIVAKDTIDEGMALRLEGKASVQDAVMLRATGYV